MPISRIEVGRRWPPQQQQFLIQAVHTALVVAFKIPEHDRLVRYIEHSAEHFATPPDASANYTLVEITVFPGRSLDAKRELYREIVARFAEIGISPGDIRIVLHEVPRDNWGIRGGTPASEVELGFEVSV